MHSAHKRGKRRKGRSECCYHNVCATLALRNCMCAAMRHCAHAARHAFGGACPGMHGRAPRAGPDGELPEALAKVDPQTLELVCAEILDRRSSVRAHALSRFPKFLTFHRTFFLLTCQLKRCRWDACDALTRDCQRS